MRKLLFLLLVVMVLCGTVAAYEVPQDFTDLTLEEAITEFREYYQLTEENFSISYYNTVTKESYDFNEYHFAIAASTYKLPLNMYFYELEAKGEIDPSQTFRHTGMPLAQVHEQSIQYSNNEVSEAMTGYWINYEEYKKAMLKYSDIADEDVPRSFYETNHSCTKVMMDTLKYLYEREDEFSELIGYMKLAMPGEYFQAGVTEYEVAHKYGQVNEYINDVAIIYTPQPILLAVYTQGVYGTGICAEAARLVTNYTVWKTRELSANAIVGNFSAVAVQTLQNISGDAPEVLEPTEEVTETENVTEMEEEWSMPQSGIANEVTSFVALAVQRVKAYLKDPSAVEEWIDLEEEPEQSGEETEQPEEEPEQPGEETEQPEEKPEQPEEKPEQPEEKPEQPEEEPTDETEPTEEDDDRIPEPITSVTEDEEENKAIWILVGVGSLLLLVAIPILLRKRY